MCSDPANDLILSVTSLWEMQIKLQLGKLNLRLSLGDIVSQQVAANGVIILPVHAAHVFALAELPAVHKDPFDRLLVAQANIESALLVSADAIFDRYPVQTAW